MATLEMVEKLRQRANVTYDEAKAALEACGDDLLEAMIYLEKQGKTAPSAGGYYSTQNQYAYAEQQAGGQWQAPPQQKGESFGQVMSRFGAWVAGLIEKGNANSFEVHQQSRKVISLPVTVLVVLAVFCFWIVIPLMIVGLFFGCKYRFSGPELADTKVNEVMESAAKAADELKSEVKKKHDEHQEYKDQQQK